MGASKYLARAFNLLLKPVYKAYEKWLWLQIRGGPMPMHIGIIPDGNRRWARQMGLNPIEGHEHGYEKVKEVLKWIWSLGTKVVTIYAMSTENCLYRDEDERKHLMDLVKKGLVELMNSEEIHKYGVRVRVVGKLDLVPNEVVKIAKEVEEKTKDLSERNLYIALCYGGRQEILDGVRKIAIAVKNGEIEPEHVTEKYFRKYLYTADIPDPDLVIRTSGEVRISNFLLWQIAYSELYFCDAYWPDFRKIDFWRAVRSYQVRERRFGR